MAQWVRIASRDECPPGSSCERLVGDRIIAIFNVDGSYHAIDGVCPHQAGPLAQGRVDGHVVTCPWHGWQFDLRGSAATAGASPTPICYSVKTDGNDVLVLIDEEP